MVSQTLKAYNNRAKISKCSASVIVPCFNSSKTVKELLRSLERQTFKNFEIIIVDDGSIDNTKNIITSFCKNSHLNIRYFYKNNGGVSSARNFGIKKATSDNILFLDSDDIIMPTLINDLIKAKTQSACDLIISNAIINGKNNRCLVESVGRAFETITSEQMIISIFSVKMANRLFHFKYDFGRSVCGKLYNRDIIIKNKLSFDNNIYMFEDGFFNLNYLNHIEKICYVDKPLYIYRIELGNSANFRHNLIEENRYKISRINEYAKIKNSVKIDTAKDIFLIDLFFSFIKQFLCNVKLEISKKNQMMKREYEKYDESFNAKTFKYLNLKKKFLYIIIKMRLYALILLLYEKRLMK